METPRKPQEEALRFIWNATMEGYEDIVVAAPTGIGKTGIGAAFCFWSSAVHVSGWDSGGYYLVTQKMLQDQLERDFPRFQPGFFGRAANIKSATEYRCRTYGTCGMGSKMKKDRCCRDRLPTSLRCPYLIARNQFVRSDLAVTNYPYFFTEHMFVNKLRGRNVLVADECHTLEKQITGFVELVVNADTLEAWAPHLRPLPSMPTVDEFIDWLEGYYVDALKTRMEGLAASLESSRYSNAKMLSEYNQIENHLGRTMLVMSELAKNTDSWVYWQEPYKNQPQSTAKPLSASPFVPLLLNEMAATRLYMSAYPGPKRVFCRSLGLDPARTAWLELDSTFPVEHRPINIFKLGSMSRKGIEGTFPGLCEVSSHILEAHNDSKGIIHCHSYKLGDRIYDYFMKTPHAHRLIYPSKSADRRAAMERHTRSSEPTVLLSPSIAEGYSFDDDLARFQIIAKVPFPYLGDRQVSARTDSDPEWYVLQTAMTILQACGRIVRSDTDYGHTYILDSDFVRLTEENPQFFPKWFTKAFKYIT